MATQTKPNILFLMSDGIGWFNISAYNLGAYNLGIMGYRTPNIDRIAKEGALFTDFYGQQRCTAGRAAFITASRRFARDLRRWDSFRSVRSPRASTSNSSLRSSSRRPAKASNE